MNSKFYDAINKTLFMFLSIIHLLLIFLVTMFVAGQLDSFHQAVNTL